MMNIDISSPQMKNYAAFRCLLLHRGLRRSTSTSIPVDRPNLPVGDISTPRILGHRLCAEIAVRLLMGFSGHSALGLTCRKETWFPWNVVRRPVVTRQTYDTMQSFFPVLVYKYQARHDSHAPQAPIHFDPFNRPL
jgi:hypothetical protein